MLVLTADNDARNTDDIQVREEVHYSVLKMQDPSAIDFYMDVVEYLNEFASAAITLRIGEYEIVMPLHWSLLCTDMEYVHSIPLCDLGGRRFPAFCLNPIDGFMPEFLSVRTGTIFPQVTWTAPPVNDKDLLVVPIGASSRGSERGPMCAIFSGSKVEVHRPIGDIW